MSDLISRQTALNHLRKRLIQTANNNVGFVCDAGSTFEDASERVKTWLDEIPSAEPERKKGEWLCDSYCLIFKRKIWRCSVCGNLLDFEGVNAGRGDANYCPNCGADMRGQEV